MSLKTSVLIGGGPETRSAPDASGTLRGGISH